MSAHHTGSFQMKVRRFGPHKMGQKGPAKRMNQGKNTGHGRYSRARVRGRR